MVAAAGNGAVNVQPPQVSDGGTDADKRTSEKLERSPGSFFVARSNQLVLAPAYFHRLVPEGAYRRTANRHLANLCGATYALMLSAFELTWKTLYARIIDVTDAYDGNLTTKHKGGIELTTENVLAHREQATAGGMIASGYLTWQQPDKINERFEQLVKIEPIAADRHATLRNLWQIRHVLAHSSGVLSPQDAYRLTWDLEAGDALQIGIEYLKAVEAELLDVVKLGVQKVGKRLLNDFFGDATVAWEKDHDRFERLALLGMVVERSQPLPEVNEAMFEAERQPPQPEEL